MGIAGKRSFVFLLQDNASQYIKVLHIFWLLLLLIIRKYDRPKGTERLFRREIVCD